MMMHPFSVIDNNTGKKVDLKSLAKSGECWWLSVDESIDNLVFVIGEGGGLSLLERDGDMFINRPFAGQRFTVSFDNATEA